MQLFSSPPKSQFPLFSPSQNPNSSSKSPFKLPTKLFQSPSLLKLSPSSSSSSQSPAPPLPNKLSTTEIDPEIKSTASTEDGGVLVVRRPVKEPTGEEIGESLKEKGYVEENENSKSVIDQELSKFAKKMPMFEPKRVDASAKEKPLGINLELALYKAKVLARNYQIDKAIEILHKCILYWPEDGRPYVALGKILSKQSRNVEARALYERGCQATQGDNSYIWQCWAVLEKKMGNIRKARELFDAATVADKKHIAAWHGWAILELQQGNVNKARNLLGKGLKYCGGNEYVYQTLALLEAKANRIEQARYLFKQATKCNPKSCASWLAWAQVEMQQENKLTARKLFEKAVQASPKNRFAWHVWGLFEANLGDIDKGRKLLKIGHALNPRDPVLLQSLALLEYQYSAANLARVLFRRASELDPRHQPVWVAWGWMEWKEGNLDTARQLYQKALSINPTTESASRCLQAWGVLEQRVGNFSAARRLFRSSLNINSQSYVTWMTWASMEEEQGNSARAEEIRDLYFQQRTELVDDSSSWVLGFSDIIDPALDSIKRLLNLDQSSYLEGWEALRERKGVAVSSDDTLEELRGTNKELGEENPGPSSPESDFNLDAFARKKLSLDTSNLDILMETQQTSEPKKPKPYRRIWRPKSRTPA